MADLGAVGKFLYPHVYSPPKKFTGTVSNATSLPIHISLHLQSTGELMWHGKTLDNGTFTAPTRFPYNSAEHYIVALDSDEQARVFDHITPGE